MGCYRFFKVATVAFVSFHLLTAGKCSDEIDNAIIKADSVITKADAVVAANQSLYSGACSKGQLVHDTIQAKLNAGTLIMSAKDQANELATYNSGVMACPPNTPIPTTLSALLRAIPSITAWVASLSKWAGV